MNLSRAAVVKFYEEVSFMKMSSKRLRIFTWDTNSAYLYYLFQAPHDFFVLNRESNTFPERNNVQALSADEVKNASFDCLLFQSLEQFNVSQYKILSAAQRQLPRIYIEYKLPSGTPGEAKHEIDDQETLLIHMTHYNNLMWNCGETPTRVIEPGVVIADGASYIGDTAAGLSVANYLSRRGRLLGADIFQRFREEVPMNLLGAAAEEIEGGLGQVLHKHLPAFMSHYRFYLNTFRHGSLSLALCEAMMVGMPIITLATTEMPTVIRNGYSGYIDTDISFLIEHARWLLSNRSEARRLGQGAKALARERFNIDRFIRDWNQALNQAMDIRTSRSPVWEVLV